MILTTGRLPLETLTDSLVYLADRTVESEANLDAASFAISQYVRSVLQHSRAQHTVVLANSEYINVILKTNTQLLDNS